MKGKKFIKKLVAIALVLCMFVPFLTYVDFSSLFHSDKVSAATIDAAGVGGVTAVKTTTADGKYYVTRYQENIDTDNDGITDSYIDIAQNPSSQYYTSYRKAEYYRTGNVNAYGQTPTIDNHSFDMMVRYDGAGNPIANFKSNSSAKKGSQANPIVLVEIVPDAMVTQLSLMFAGEEAFDVTYASLFCNGDPNTFVNYKTAFKWLSQEGINSSVGQAAGVIYNNNTFLKEVYGYGYKDCKPKNAPLVDQYQFVGWYLGDAEGNGYFNPTLYSEDNNLITIGGWPNPHKWDEIPEGLDLHLYARWKYKYYIGSYGGDDVWYDAPYDRLIDSSIDVTMDGADIDINGNGKIDGNEVSVVNYANRYIANSITFHLVKPSGMGVSFTNSKGTYTDNDVTALAPISFANDYDFSTGMIATDVSIYNTMNTQENKYKVPYPSLMGNTDYKIKSSDECNVQVVVLTAQELSDALSNGKKDAYINLLTNSDMVYLENKQYGGSIYGNLNDFIKKYSASESDVAAKLKVTKNIINTGLNKDFSDDSKLQTLISNNFSVSTEIKNLDIEGYVAETLFANMAGKNSLRKEVPLVFDTTSIDGAGTSEQNIKKLFWLSVVNNDATITYEDWHSDGNRLTLVNRDSSKLAQFPCALQTLKINHFVAGEQIAWSYYSVYPTKTGFDIFHNPTDANLEERTQLLAKGYFNDDASRGNEGDMQVTYNLMTYNGNQAIFQAFLSYNYHNTDYTKDVFDYLADEGTIESADKTITPKTSTGFTFRFLLNATGGRNDAIVIANQNSTGTDESGTIETAIVTNIVGSGIQDVVYYIDTNIGTEYYVRYYKVNAFRPTLESTLAASNVLAEYQVTADPAAVTDTTLISYKVRDDDSFAQNAGANIPNEVSTSVSWGASTLPSAVHYIKPSSTDPNGSLGKLSVTLQSLAGAGSSDKYLIVAYHEDGRAYIFKYVEIRKARLPFSLD